MYSNLILVSMNTIVRQNDERLDALEVAMVENFPLVECPLVHRFVPGMYIREITMPAGSLITSKIHKTCHPFTISKGKCAVSVDGQDWTELEAPYTGITQPGTRRVLYILEDCVWTTYHPLPFITGEETNIEETVQQIEDLIIEKHDNLLLQEKLKELA